MNERAPHYSGSNAEMKRSCLGNEGEFDRLEGVLPGKRGLPREPDVDWRRFAIIKA
jgi:hypothetical protein